MPKQRPAMVDAELVIDSGSFTLTVDAPFWRREHIRVDLSLKRLEIVSDRGPGERIVVELPRRVSLHRAAATLTRTGLLVVEAPFIGVGDTSHAWLRLRPDGTKAARVALKLLPPFYGAAGAADRWPPQTGADGESS